MPIDIISHLAYIANMGTKPSILSEQLKAEIRDSGLSHYRIAMDAGIRPEQIDRFMSGERDLRLESASKLAAVLGLELKPKRRKRG